MPTLTSTLTPTPTLINRGELKSLAPASLPCSLGIQFAVLEDGKWRMTKITAKVPTRQKRNSAGSSSTDGQDSSINVSPLHDDAGAASNPSMVPKVASAPAGESKPASNNAGIVANEFVDVDLEGQMVVEITEEETAEVVEAKEVSETNKQVGGSDTKEQGENENVVIRGHSFAMNKLSRRASSTADVLEEARQEAASAASGASARATLAKQPRRSSVSDAL